MTELDVLRARLKELAPYNGTALGAQRIAETRAKIEELERVDCARDHGLRSTAQGHQE